MCEALQHKLIISVVQSYVAQAFYYMKFCLEVVSERVKIVQKEAEPSQGRNVAELALGFLILGDKARFLLSSELNLPVLGAQFATLIPGTSHLDPTPGLPK